MAFTLPDLPYERSALAPHISEETLNFPLATPARRRAVVTA